MGKQKKKLLLQSFRPSGMISKRKTNIQITNSCHVCHPKKRHRSFLSSSKMNQKPRKLSDASPIFFFSFLAGRPLGPVWLQSRRSLIGVCVIQQKRRPVDGVSGNRSGSNAHTIGRVKISFFSLYAICIINEFCWTQERERALHTYIVCDVIEFWLLSCHFPSTIFCCCYDFLVISCYPQKLLFLLYGAFASNNQADGKTLLNTLPSLPPTHQAGRQAL